MEDTKTKNNLIRYNQLFSDDKSKAKAFDAIAENFYAGNFGKLSKADTEVLLFHLYIEQILAINDNDYNTYSDFKLSKELGIPKSKIQIMKVKKQLQYPYEYNWRESFKKITHNVRYEGNRIKLQIPDINLFYEIENAVNEAGGFIDISLTPKLLQIPPEYFLDLLVLVYDESQEKQKKFKKELLKELKKHIEKTEYVQEVLEREPIGKQIGHLAKDVTVDVVKGVLTNLLGGGTSVLGTSIHLVRSVVEAIS